MIKFQDYLIDILFLIVLSFLLASVALSQTIDEKYFDPDYVIDSSLGDGVQDATEEIENRIKAITSRRESSHTFLTGGSLNFSSGIYRVTRTIVLPDGIGLRIQGNGCAAQLPTKGVFPQGGPWLNNKFEFLATALLYDGVEGGTIVRFDGKGGTIDGISLWGANKAGIGYEAHHHKGIATGHTRIGYITVSGCDTGFQFGGSLQEGNCADCTFQHLEIHNCSTGFKVINHQGMNWHFGFYQASNCGTMIHLKAGGKFHCSLLSPEKVDTILKTGDQGFGNGSIVIEHVVADAQQVQFPCVLEASTTSGSLTVIFNHLHFPKALADTKPRITSPIFSVPKNVRVIIHSGEYLPKNAIPSIPNIIASNVLTTP